jgi:hypothetical protein
VRTRVPTSAFVHVLVEDRGRRELCEELDVQAVPRRRLYTALMPDEVGVDYGILVDLLTDVPTLGVDPMVVGWAWRSLDCAGDLWQVDRVRKALEAGSDVML